ncbi:hypothetical protein [Natrinema salinisoli]|uniref:hypothetical protein n=1 Tax=Natrinema salinisoli TaxID=2878535 RepID=UPI001CF077ED|nr:hypothetical protein [Natrinema salinisoli]
MTTWISLSPVERVPRDTHVTHYDQLADQAKNRLPRLLEEDETVSRTPDSVGAMFETHEIVKYTDYYRITVTEERP